MDIDTPFTHEPEDAADAPAAPPRRPQIGPLLSRLALIVILLLGAYFRTLSLTNWDSGTGQHPDERFFTDVASTVRLPADLSELYDSSRSTLNPRNYSQFPLFVYGPFPIILTRAVAVSLTPSDWDGNPVLPEQVPSINGPPRVGIDGSPDVHTDFGPLVPNPERSFPKLSFLFPLFNPEGKNLTTYGEIVKVGRGLAALFDLGSIVLIFLIARRLFGRREALLAALLAALAVMPIQQSHFFVDPIFSTFFALLTLYWAVRTAQGGGWLAYTALGLSIGAAMANRITMATLGLVAVVAAVVIAVQAGNAKCKMQNAREPFAWLPFAFDHFLRRELVLLVLAGALTLLSFRSLAPDAFSGTLPGSPMVPGEPILDIGALAGKGFFDMRPEPRFLGNLTTVRALVTGEYDFPPSQQWVGRTAYVFPWTNMVLWGMGPALGLAAWIGWAAFGILGVVRIVRAMGVGARLTDRAKQTARLGNQEEHDVEASALSASPLRVVWAALVLWVWAGFYFAWQGGQFAITMRYLLPIYGALIIFAAWLLVWLWDYGRQVRQQALMRGAKYQGVVARALAAVSLLVVLITLGWAYAFSRIYTLPHSRVMAARWLADHAPSGSYVMSEIWDDPLPLQATSANWGSTYQGIGSAPYAEDEERKYFGATNSAGQFEEGLIDQLDQADYITLTSNRVYDSTSRLRMRYPALMRYYYHLFQGDLGFRLAAEVTSYPTIFGIRIPDQRAEEAFSVYDHPRVLIFEKTADYSHERVADLITGDVNWGEVYKSPVIIADRNPTALRLTDSQWPLYAAGGDWVNTATNSLVSQVAPLSWIVVLELLGLAGFALLFRLLPGLPDRGFSLAKILALLLVAYVAWLLGSLKLAPFAPGTLWLCAAPLLAIGALMAWRQRDELRDFWQTRRTALLSAEAIFLGFLLLGLLLRWLNPDLWHPARGGEKPMDFAYLNAVLRSAAFPPYDPWHAGGYINYYYFGFVIVGALIHLSGAVPSVGYNLAVATIFGLTALGAWGVVYNLLARRGSSSKDRRALLSAGLAPVFMLLLGNLAQAIWYLGGYAAEQAAKGRPEWAFWDATRIVPGTVNEFPFFTFLFADLHAHMIVMPLSLALLGVAVAFVRRTKDEGQKSTDDRRPFDRGVWWAIRRGTLPFYVLRSTFYVLTIGLLAGAIRATNTWDYPTYVGLTALIVAWTSFRNQRRAGQRVPGALAVALLYPIGFVLVGNLLFLPFTQNFTTESSGIDLLREGLASSSLAQVLLAERTTTWDLLRLYGHWIVIAAIGGLLLIRRYAGDWAAIALGLGLALLIAACLIAGWPAPVLLLPMLVIAVWLLWQICYMPPRLMLPALWSAAALGLALLVELVVVKGDVGRMNTVFKFGLHIWTLFALSGAVLVPWMWSAFRMPVADSDERRKTKDESGGMPEPSSFALRPSSQTGDADSRSLSEPSSFILHPSSFIYVIRGAIVLLLVAALVYPLTATPARLADRWVADAPRSLDGAAFMASVSEARNGAGYSLDEDAAAIDWLQRNAVGNPVILEAHQPSYQWADRVATYTGLPTILGWEWHQIQQRNAVNAGPAIAYRQQTIARIYNTLDAQEALKDLHAYGVAYIYVGGVERSIYDQAGLAKFATMADQGELELAFSQGQTRIYRVVDPGTPEMLTNDLPIKAPTKATPPPLLLDSQVNELPAVDEYAWNGLVRNSSLASTILWLLVFYLLALIGAPVAFLVFGRWRDGGVSWARLIGLLMLGYAVWMPTSLGFWHYNAWGVLGGLVLVLIADGAALWWIGLRVVAGRLRSCRRYILRSELVFLAAFLLLAGIRALNPDLWHPVWGGEKPMEFGFLNAILRSPVMPPYDPFFSDGYINYYYYGLFLVSLPIKLSGISPAIGFNLAVATAFGLTMAGAYSLVHQISGRSRVGLIGAALVGLAGNLAAIFAAGWSRGLAGVLNALREGGLGQLGAKLGDWYVGPSRVIPNTINEFPAFTFLFADLHPHMIALPITLLVIALAYTIVSTRRASPLGWRAAFFAPLPLGALAVTNSWDFPTYTLLFGLALLGAAWRGGGPRARGIPWGALGRAAGVAVAVALAAMALYVPFFDRYYAFVRGVGLVHFPEGTGVVDYLLVYGFFMAVLLPVFAGMAWRVLASRARARNTSSDTDLGLVASARPPLTLVGRWSLLGAGLLIVLAGIIAPGFALRIALAAFLLISLPILLRRQIGTPAWFTLLLAWVGWAVSLGIEIVYIRDHLDSGEWYRMNTVFKFGLQIWVLLALAAACSLPVVWRGLRRIGGPAAQSVGSGLLAVLGVLALIYPLAATPARVANRFAVNTGPTLDGLAFMRQASFSYDCDAFGGCEPGVSEVTVDLRGDAAAIEWLNREIHGTPVLVQSDLWFYRAYGIRIAANTGLPTVISALHASEQRDGYYTGQRDDDVSQFYRSSNIDTALRFLAKYHVNYVYVGGVERAFYPQAGLAKFDTMRGTYLDAVYDTPEVQIYQVRGIPASYAQPAPYDFSADAPVERPTQVTGDVPAGLEELEQAVARDPGNGPLAFGLAEKYRAMGRLDDAARVLAPAAANPQDIGVHHLLGDILSEAGRYDEAEQAYLAAAQAQPTAGNWNKLGTALLAWNKLDKAELALKQAVSIDPSEPDPYFQLGRLFAQRGDREQAVSELGTYLSLAPEGPWAAEARRLLSDLGE